MIIAKTKARFYDLHGECWRTRGEFFEVDYPRLKELVGKDLVSPHRIDCRGGKVKVGPKIIIYQKLLYRIGGIETWGRNLAKTFADRDIQFVFEEADPIQMMAISKYADTLIDDKSRTYDCDVLISANYDGASAFLNRVNARKKYQTIHSDFSALMKSVPGWRNFKLYLDPRFDAILTASDTAKMGLLNGFGRNSTVAKNILAEPEDKPLTLVTLSRASGEKGLGRMVALAQALEKTGREFVWFVAATLDNTDNPSDAAVLRSIPEIVEVKPGFYSKNILYCADYLVQLSDTEAYCYSMREALQLGVPVIVTEFDEAKKVVKDGENGYILNFDLSNLDAEKICTQIPKPNDYREEVPNIWRRILNGKF